MFKYFFNFSRVALLVTFASSPAAATDWHVASGGNGTGTAASPFGRIQDAIAAAQPGDVVLVGPGTFSERLTSARAGSAQLPIIVKPRDGRGSSVVTASGRVLTVGHAYLTIEDLVLDGQFGNDDLIRIGSAATGFTLRNSEVRRTTYDAIDMGAVSDVLIEGSLIHHALNAAGGRTDAHGIVAGAARRLTIRNTEIHTFSGDAFQIDPGRAAPGWDNVLIERCRFWLQPLPVSTNGFPAGAVPGENAIDTKVGTGLNRPNLTIRNTEAYGFRNGLIGNMAAFNIKENVNAVLDGVTVHSSEIAFRLRAPATVRVQNAVVYNVSYGVRYEDDIQGIRIWNTTFGSGVTEAFRAASSPNSVLDVQNVAFLAASKPVQATGPSNLALTASAFVDVTKHNYQLIAGSPAVDRGVTLAEVGVDRQGTKRPQGPAYDVGAFERVVSVSSPDPTADTEVVLHAWKSLQMVGNWQVVPDPAASGGARLSSTDERGKRTTSLKQAAADYFEMTFNAEAGQPYRLWIRGLAANDSSANDSVFVQFSGAVDANGVPLFKIGSNAATEINLEDCAGCGLSGWGWQDNGAGANVLGPPVYFAKTGPQTIRILVREDGISIDQIVLSPSAYLTKSPGALKQDTTILAESF